MFLRRNKKGNFKFHRSFISHRQSQNLHCGGQYCVPPTPYRPSKTFYWIKLQSQTTSNVTAKNTLLYFYCPLYSQFNVAEQQKIQFLAASVIHISILNEGRGGDCRSVTFASATIVGSKNKNIYLRDFKDVGFNFTHFANFKFAYFEIELGKLTKWPISFENFHFGHLKGAHFKYRLYFSSCCV